MSSQALVAGNSEVGWQWENEEEKRAEIGFKSKTVETKVTEKSSYKKREERLKEIEYKMRQAENNRAAELLRKRCEKFEKQLKEGNDENRNKVLNLQPKKLFDEKSKASPTRTKSMKDETTYTKTQNKDSSKDRKLTKALSTIENRTDTAADDDFFNDSAMDDLLLVATQQVEQEISLTQQTLNTVSNAKIACISKNSSKEKRSSMYMKFLEDDCPDDLFGNLDDIIAQAIENAKPKSSFQRYNSMPIESMSPRSNAANKQQIPTNSSKPLANRANDHHAIKRHASTHDVQIYAPQKMKQIRRI